MKTPCEKKIFRNEAEIIYSCLKFCKKNQELGITKLKKYTAEQINNYNEMKLEYIEFVNLDSFKKINQLEKKKINHTMVMKLLV